MSGLLRRIRPRRDAASGPAEAGTQVIEPATAETAEAPAEHRSLLADPAPEPATEPTVVAPDAPAEAPPVPAGLAPEDLIGDRPDTRRRGRLRKRLRHLRRVRELMLRDVGGLVFEIHRAGDGSHGRALVDAKLERLAALDAERRELEAALGDRRAETVLHEPGVGGTCPTCGEYFASDARFCSSCATPVDGRAAPVPPDAEPPAAAPAAVASDPALPAARAEPQDPSLSPAPIDPPTEVRS